MRLLTLLTNARIKANNVDPDQTTPLGAVWSGSTLFVEETSKAFQQTTKHSDDNYCDWRFKG